MLMKRVVGTAAGNAVLTSGDTAGDSAALSVVAAGQFNHPCPQWAQRDRTACCSEHGLN